MKGISVFNLKDPLFFDVFVDNLADLTLEAPTMDIAVAALRLQRLLMESRSEIVNNPTDCMGNESA